MRQVRPLVLVLCLAVVALAGCGADAAPDPPRAGILGGSQRAGTGARIRVRRPFDPVPSLLRCLRESKVRGARRRNEEVMVGPAAQGLRIRFLATGGVAETAQLEGRAEGAEVLGRALLYPGRAPERILKRVEDCAGDAGLRE